MRICLLTDQDLDDPTLAEEDWPCDPRPYLSDATWEVATLGKATAVARVLELAGRDFDLFFNLCDGAWGEPSPGIEVVEALERLDVAFTGATSAFYEPSREAMKRVCRAWEIETPRYVVAESEEDVDRALDTLSFPMIVKHPSSYASIGLTRDSRVEKAEDLRERAREMMSRFAGALVEEFVEGTECTVLVAENAGEPDEPLTYAPIAYEFPEGESFKHSEMKWVEYARMRSSPVSDPDLAERLRGASTRLFRGLDGTGYGRCDLRVDADGRAYMLEINPNCGVYYAPEDAGSADLILLADPAGHEGFTRRVVESALLRHERRERAWRVLPRPGGDYGLFASRALAAGETILAFEERAHELATRSHVERTWRGRRLEWFRRYAWPLTDEVWVTWSRDPERWRPVNHSCDPNAWLEGLDVTARRPIERGEEITLDYATFCHEEMPGFDCACGTPACRGRVGGEDHLGAFVARYGDHVSDYVRRRRREAGVA